MYEIRLERERKLVVLRVWGFWTEATMDGFATDIAEAVRRMGFDRGGWSTLCLANDFGVQSNAIVARHTDVFVRHGAVWGPRVATVINSALLRLQHARAFPGETRNVFADEAAARDWLAIAAAEDDAASELPDARSGGPGNLTIPG